MSLRSSSLRERRGTSHHLPIMRMRPLNLRIFTDGGARGNPGPAGCGAVIKDADTGETLKELHQYLGETTNNQAEYQAVIMGLKEALTMDPESIMIVADSELLVKQLTGVYRVKNPGLAERFMEVRNLEVRIGKPVRYRHVPRAQNKEADALANKAMDEGKRM
jgi:ribonuclease HI